MGRYKYLILACVAFAASSLSAYAIWRSEQKTPGLETVNPVKDFGSLDWGEHEGSFELTNRSSQPLRIWEVSTSCDCAQVKAPAREIQPSESILIQFKWNTKGKNGPSSTSLAVIYGNGTTGSEKILRLMLKGDVRADYNFTPTMLSFCSQKTDNQSVVFFSTQPDFMIKEVSCSHHAFQAEMDVKDHSLKVSFDASQFDLEVDRPRQELAVSTTNAMVPICKVPITVSP